LYCGLYYHSELRNRKIRDTKLTQKTEPQYFSKAADMFLPSLCPAANTEDAFLPLNTTMILSALELLLLRTRHINLEVILAWTLVFWEMSPTSAPLTEGQCRLRAHKCTQI